MTFHFHPLFFGNICLSLSTMIIILIPYSPNSINTLVGKWIRSIAKTMVNKSEVKRVNCNLQMRYESLFEVERQQYHFTFYHSSAACLKPFTG